MSEIVSTTVTTQTHVLTLSDKELKVLYSAISHLSGVKLFELVQDNGFENDIPTCKEAGDTLYDIYQTVCKGVL
jgi:hypothetical protein